MLLKRYSFLIIPALLIGACKDYKPEMEKAMMERDSVIVLGSNKDSSINAFLTTLNDIETNLDSITQNQEAIAEETKDKVEFNKDIRERININIQAINELLEKNKSMIGSLNDKLRKSNFNIASLKKMIDKLNGDVAVKDTEIAALSVQLTDLKLMVDNLNRGLDSLNQQNVSKAAVISDQTSQLNTAYWTIGTYKDLKAKNILSKQGGFLGLGKEKVLKKDFNNDGFNKIDITQVVTIEINNKSAKILTNHPSDSYVLEKDKDKVTNLKITDPARFWKASKYLVIVTG